MKTFVHVTSGVLWAILLCAPTAHAAESDFYGLMRSRDLTPFGFLRLDMRPAHAVAIEPGTWALEQSSDTRTPGR